MANIRVMRSFFRRQLTYFIWGFAVSLLIIVAMKIGFGELVNYAAISAAVGVVVSGVIFMLERRFPDTKPPVE